MKLNLVVDISGIFYRSLFTIGNYGSSKGEKLLDSKSSQGIFMRKLTTDFVSLVKDVENPSKVIVCMDSSSWRKSVLIEDGAYKSDRKKDESTINWEVFFNLTDKFCEILSNKGYIISRVPGAEADDLLFFWSKKLNNEGENVMLITGDRDLLQVLKQNSNGTWTIALDPVSSRKKISLTQETFDNKNVSESTVPDIFNTSTWETSTSFLESLIANHEVNIVNTTKISAIKVLMGDSGDSVPPAITWKDKKDPEKTRSMTENTYMKIVELYPHISDATWEDYMEGKYVEELSSGVEAIKKVDIDREIVKANMFRNCKLVILSDKTIPIQIQQSFDKSAHNLQDSIAITSKDSILNGTEWWSSDKNIYVPKSYDLFD